jgi:hypothetical protein
MWIINHQTSNPCQTMVLTLLSCGNNNNSHNPHPTFSPSSCLMAVLGENFFKKLHFFLNSPKNLMKRGV